MVKRFLFVTILVLMGYFNSKSQDYDSTQDSTNNEYFYEEQSGDEPYENNSAEYTENENLRNYYFLDSVKTKIQDYSYQGYRLEFSFGGYESQHDETYYFDTLSVLCAYQCTWFMEGVSGEFYYLFDNGKLTSVYDEKTGQTDESDITILDANSGYYTLTKYESETYSNLKNLLDQITLNLENGTEDEYNIRITLEETKDYGIEITETTTISIDKPLYEQLIKQK